MLSYLVDIQRTRQYMNIVRTQLLWRSTRADIGFLDSMRRGLLPLPFDRPAAAIDPFPPMRRRTLRRLSDRRVAVIATGGSGALASMVGVVRALEEAGVRPVGYGVCSGSALFGIPLAAGMPAGEVARAVQSWSARDYLDPDWWSVITAPGRLGQGWAGLLRGDRIEETYRRMLGDVTLGELPTPVWLPVWNIEDNRLEYLGPDTHPEVTAARAVRMAVALPIAIQPNELDGGSWLDGGIVDIIPAEPFVDTGRCDLAIVVNCFYPAGFTGDEERRWRRRPFSIVHVANQTRTMQHLQLARRSLADLRRTVPDVIEMEPVAYSKVQGAGLYGQFLDSREWAGFMTDGYHAAAGALRVFRPAEARVG
jgi:NTE family protein